MKKQYKKSIIEIIVLDEKDVIVTSGKYKFGDDDYDNEMEYDFEEDL